MIAPMRFVLRFATVVAVCSTGGSLSAWTYYAVRARRSVKLFQ